jgi:hypothetical protein
MSEQENGIFTKEELEALVRALARGQSEFTEPEAKIVYEWAADVRVEATALDLVLAGELNLQVDHDAEIRFTANEEE